MDTESAKKPFVAILLGKESDAEVMQHTVNVLNSLKISSEVVQVQAVPDDQQWSGWLAGIESRGARVLILASFYSYSNELFPSFSETLIPSCKVVTGPPPESEEQLNLNTAFMGFGLDGAEKAALFAARILRPLTPS